MAGMTSFASQAFQVLGAVNTVLGAVNQFSNDSGKQDYEAQQRKNQMELQNVQEKAALEKRQIALNAQVLEEERRNALRRAIARQKAVYGASGTDSSTGSGQAVLLGLVSDSEDERARRQALDTLKTASADQAVAQQQRINTLQLTQLRERDKYNQYTAAYDLGSAVNNMLKDSAPKSS